MDPGPDALRPDQEVQEVQEVQELRAEHAEMTKKERFYTFWLTDSCSNLSVITQELKLFTKRRSEEVKLWVKSCSPVGSEQMSQMFKPEQIKIINKYLDVNR